MSRASNASPKSRKSAKILGKTARALCKILYCNNDYIRAKERDGCQVLGAARLGRGAAREAGAGRARPGNDRPGRARGPTNGRAARRRRLGAGRRRGRGDGGPRQRPPETSGHPFPPLKRRIAAYSPPPLCSRGPSPPDVTWGRRAAAGGHDARRSPGRDGPAQGQWLSARAMTGHGCRAWPLRPRAGACSEGARRLSQSRALPRARDDPRQRLVWGRRG